MNRKLVYMVIVVVAVFFVIFSNAHGVDENKGAEIIVIEKGRMPEVTFPHHRHQQALENECNVCHDLFPKEPGIIKKLILQKQLRNQQVMNSKCIQCHKEKIAAGVKAGPTTCTQCHVRS